MKNAHALVVGAASRVSRGEPWYHWGLPMFHEGALLAGKYRVERRLGAGGMGYVLAAIHEQLDQRVAVKLLAPELCENKDAVLRFLREARAAVRIRSEHVARVLDVDELEDGSPYMVMEFLSGQDLSRELHEQSRFDPRIAIEYLLQACEAVAEAHSLGVIHRDLKPANLFLTLRPDGTPLVKVLDFGISKAISPDTEPVGESLTAPHSLLGSPAYMSPEQIRQPKTVDIRTDIWSLGAILYEFLTGDPPFRGDTPMSVLAAVVSDPVPSIRDKNPDIPADLESVVARCLEKDPANRYQSVAELAHALAPYAPSAALSSVTRISGILRSFLPPQNASSTTLRSATSLPSHDEPEAQVSKPGIVSATSNDKSTQTDWDASRPTAGMSRWRTRVVVVSVAVLAAAILLLVVRPVGQAPGGEPVSASAVGAVAPRVEPSPKALPVLAVEQAGAAVVNAPPDAGARAGPVNVPKAKAAKAAAASSRAPMEAPTPAHATAKGLTAHPPSDDPLEGRR